MEGDPGAYAVDHVGIIISIHAFRVEGDLSPTTIRISLRDFNPRLPCGRRHRRNHNAVHPVAISIHAFRVEGDRTSNQTNDKGLISIHAFRVEGDKCLGLSDHVASKFQSTPSVWKATVLSCTAELEKVLFQSTPSVWKATMKTNYLVTAQCISIHAFRVEGD